MIESEAMHPPVPAARRLSSAGFVTKSGHLIDGTHIGVFEEDLELQHAAAGPPKAAFDMTTFLESLREDAENSDSVRDVTLVWEGITIKTARGSTQEGIPTFIEPFRKIASIPWKIAGAIKAKRAAKAAGASNEAPQSLDKVVLNDCSGFCKPGEMALILGKPDSGASALVRALGQQGHYFRSCEGRIELNGIEAGEWMKDYGSELFYSLDEDLHLPSLTVSQTFDYALRFREKDPEKRKQWLEWLITWLGLTKAKDTVVGDSFLRGVSGGERRRVSVGEQLAANATVNAWDQCTKGLDSTYALVVVKGLRLINSILNKTSVVYLNQVSEGIYELFERVIVLAEGRVIFQGPGDRAKAYFERLGFEPLPRQSVSDFIQQCTESKEQNVRKGYLEETGRAPPVTAADFEAAWKSSSEFVDFTNEMAKTKAQVVEEKAAEKFHQAVVKHRIVTSSAGPDSVYPTTNGEIFATSFKREFALLNGQKFLVVAKWFFNLFVAFIVSSYAFQVPNDGPGAFAKASGIFFSLLINALNTNADIPAVLKARPVMYKHKNGRFLKPFWYYLATIASDLPVRFVYIVTFTVIYYWMVGFKRTAGAFSIFLLNQYMAGVAYSSQSRLLTAISSDQDMAFRLNGLLIIPSIVYSGYFIPYSEMKPWFVWLYWINPLAYAYKAMMNNEFIGTTISCENSQFPPYPGVPSAYKTCTLPGALPSSTTVSGEDWLWATREIPSSVAAIWYNFAAMLGLTILYIVLAAIVTSKVEFGKGGVVSNIFKKGFVPKDAGKADNSATIAGTRTASTSAAIQSTDQSYVSVELSAINPLRVETEELKPMAFAQRRKSTHDLSTKKLVKAPTLTFKDLSYFIQLGRNNERQLLDNVSGRVVPGRLLALMGFTGAGKTTLQDVLARRKTAGRVEGTVLVDDQPQDDSFKRIMAYCEQSDVLNPTYTVRESLRFSAYTRQPVDVSKEDKDAYVEQVLDILGLQSIAEALVGSMERGFGIGLVDRKKLNIGLQLVAKPSVLILDEPTSGLDSYAAFQIVRLLRNLADLGLAVFCTIHQPSALLFELFDDVLLIGNGGKAVYLGEIGPESSTVSAYFARNGALPRPEGENPAEYILDAGNGLRDAQGINTVKWPEIWKSSSEHASLLKAIDATVADAEAAAAAGSTADSAADHRQFALSTIQQLPLVLSYTYTSYVRDGGYNFGRIVLSIMQGIIVGFTFWQMPNTASGAVLQMFSLFSLSTLGIPYIITAVNPFDERRKYFYRDTASGMYNSFAFSLSVMITEIPFSFFPSAVFYVIIYFTYGLQYAHLAPLIFFAGIVLYHQWANSFGQSIAALAPNPELASLIVSLATTIMPAVSGVPVPYAVLPSFWHWFYQINPYRYTAEIFIANQMHELNLSCTQSELKVFNPPPGATCAAYLQPLQAAGAPGYTVNPNATSACAYCPISQGDAFMSYQLGWSYNDIGLCFGVLAALYAINRITLVLFMWMKSRSHVAAGKK